MAPPTQGEYANLWIVDIALDQCISVYDNIIITNRSRVYTGTVHVSSRNFPVVIVDCACACCMPRAHEGWRGRP